MNSNVQYSPSRPIVFILYVIIRHVMRKPTYAELEKRVKELEKTEEKLAETKFMFEGLVETSQDLIWRGESEGRFVYLNKTWEETLGYHPDEMIGHIFHEFQKEDVIKRDREEFESHLDGGSVSGHETIYYSKAGEEVNLVFNAIPLKDADGNIIGTQGTAYDVTERKKFEHELLTERNKLKSIFGKSGKRNKKNS